ncbi:MAG: glycine cleavage system aminomethyltransferase GcvT, partial [Candidatus Omnitrophota bacterium]
CNEEGYVLDDILVYQSAPNDYYLVVNACNIATDLEALKAYAPDSVTIHDQSDVTAAIAVQGPKSEEILNKLFGFDFEGLGHYAYQELHFAGKPLWVSRSGYTGEKGFEIFCSSELALQMWSRLCDDGKALGALPAGLGARNTLRLEAGNPLYGHELDRTTTPIEAGFEFAVCFDKGGFVGGDAILTKKMRGIARKLVGIRMNDKAVARDGYPVFLPGSNRIGHVTSGSYGPSVDANIGMAYVLKSAATLGTSIEIEIHGRRAQAQVVATPFIALKHRA